MLSVCAITGIAISHSKTFVAAIGLYQCTPTFDFEIYSAAQENGSEVSSVSNFESFQAKPFKMPLEKIPRQNATGAQPERSSFALPRIMAGILENNQQKQASVFHWCCKKYFERQVFSLKTMHIIKLKG